jgi:hypothetical protein
LRFSTPARLSVEDTLLERLAQDLEDMAAARGPFIQHAVVGQRHFARQRPVAPTDQPDIGDGVMGGRMVVRGQASWSGAYTDSNRRVMRSNSSPL